MPDPFINLPAISLCNTDIQALTNAFVAGFQEVWLAESGETLLLTKADRRYTYALSFINYIAIAFSLIDLSAKQNLLPYAQGGFLDAKGATYGKRGQRLPATGALAQMQFSLPIRSIPTQLYLRVP